MWKSMELLNINDDVMESIIIELHSGMILAEQMLSLIEAEDETPDTQEQKTDTQDDTQGDSQEQSNEQPTEKEETPENDTSTLGKLETLRKQVGEMLKAHDDAKFVGAYTAWVKNVKAIIGTIDDKKRKKDLLERDPFYALCQMLVAAEKAKSGEQEKPEEKKEQNAAEQEEKQMEQEAQQVADNFLNMLREKYK